jgi:hypothetical protein
LWDRVKTGERLLSNGLNTLDRVFVIWAFYRGLAPILLFQVSGVIPGQIAFWIQAFGGYFFLRYLIQDIDDIETTGKLFAILTVIFAAGMAAERLNNINVFDYLAPGHVALVRDGVVRAQASFSNSILAGCFGATLVPVFFWLWKSGRAKGLGVLGILSGALMVFFSASSTPVLAFLGGVGALVLWPIREQMRRVRWGIVIGLIVLQIVMKAPVWFIVAHVNPTGSSDVYSRAYLIDNFIRHVGDWWLVGTSQAASWGFDMWDLCNGFVAEGEVGGLVSFGCLIALFSFSFSRLGKMRKLVEDEGQVDWLSWSLGAALFATLLAFIGVSYYDQTQVWWYGLLAMVSAATVGLQIEAAPTTALQPSLELASEWERI